MALYGTTLSFNVSCPLFSISKVHVFYYLIFCGIETSLPSQRESLCGTVLLSYDERSWVQIRERAYLLAGIRLHKSTLPRPHLGLSSTLRESNLLPGSFINRFRKQHRVCLPSYNPNRLVFDKSFGTGDQLCHLPNQCLKLQMRRFCTQRGVKSEDSEGMLSSENIAIDENTLEEELQNAIAEENYAKAAEIRDTLKNLHKDSKTTVIGANSRFYDSFRNGDLAAMQAMWAKRDEVCCVHPGLKGISGYDDVIESWDFVWANYEFPLEIKLEDIKVHARGDMGYVTCMEFVKTKGGRWGGQFVTNVFERIDGEWYICVHHASPVDL